GPPRRIVTAYEDSIRLQEEERLHQRRAAQLARIEAGEAGAASRSYFVVEIKARDNVPPPAPVYFSRVELRRDGAGIGRLPLDATADDPSAPSHLDEEASAWSGAMPWQG